MKLHLLEDCIQRFLKVSKGRGDDSWPFMHSIVAHFNKVWFNNPDLSLKEKYEAALKSEISQRWWKRDNYRPREIMLKLFDADTELPEIAFKDLANENANLDGRLSRFNYYAEELLQITRRNNYKETETYHHQDAGIVSLYLAGMFPDKYALYPGIDTFRNFCKTVGSPDIPVVDDLVRYSKVTNIVFKFLEKDAAYQLFVQNRESEMHKIKFLPYQTTCEIISFGADEKNLIS